MNVTSNINMKAQNFIILIADLRQYFKRKIIVKKNCETLHDLNFTIVIKMFVKRAVDKCLCLFTEPHFHNSVIIT